MAVVVYTKPDCPQCVSTKQDMQILGIEFSEVDLTKDAAAMERFVGQGFRSAPVVETDNETWAGYNRDKIKTLVQY